MYLFSLHWLLPIGFMVTLPMAFAQSSSQPTTPDSKSAAPASVTLSYRSAFADYRAYNEQAVGSWREANDNVGRIGGWREYAKEARQPQAPDAAAKPDPRAVPAKP